MTLRRPSGRGSLIGFGLATLLLAAPACTGEVVDGTEGGGDPGTGGAGGPGPTPPPPGPPPPRTADDRLNFPSAVRRLTRTELRQTLIDLVGADLASELAKFPEDYAEANDVFAFDNKYSLQQPSAALIEAAKNLADVVGARVLADAATRQKLVACAPRGPADDACLRSFVTSFGRRALRRPLAAAEIDAYVTRFRPFAMESNDFFKAVSLTARAMLQDLEFLYRVEIGQPVAGTPGLFKLGGHEVASRLSYFLWGTMPDDALLDAAGAGDRLQTPDSVRVAAVRMLSDPRAQRGIGKFHGMWLGYERQPPPAPLARPMLDETAALLDRVIFRERRPWLDLFRMRESYVDAALAAHYDLPRPAGASGWVSYGASGRQGILAHGAFLGVERKHQDTSPTMRGQFIRTRLMCQPVPQPAPELMIDTDSVPKDGRCKSDRYVMWDRAGCQGCHLLMDPIGHGLENYDRAGKYRTLAPDDAGKPDCQISGAGQLTGAAAPAFMGVAGLSDKLVESRTLEGCVTTQLASYYLGRELRPEERALFDRVATRFADSGHRFDQMLIDFVTLPGFGQRLAE